VHREFGLADTETDADTDTDVDCADVLVAQPPILPGSPMDKAQFWTIVDQAPPDVGCTDAEAVAQRLVEILTRRSADDIAAADQVRWGLMADSYQEKLWAAAYLLNGGRQTMPSSIFAAGSSCTRKRLPRLAALFA